MDLDLGGSLMADSHANHYNPRTSLVVHHLLTTSELIRCDIGQVTTIEVLSDRVLLAIFDFHVVKDQDFYTSRDAPGIDISNPNIRVTAVWWQPLIHVCRRWRGLIFGSHHRLNLQLYCTPETLSRKTLNVWPALPLIIQDSSSDTPVDDLVSALDHSNRICQIDFSHHYLTTSQIEKVWAAMQVPFPELTALLLYSYHSPSETGPVLPESFLGGSAPRLRYLTFFHIPFPGLQKLLLSATHLVELHLYEVPHSVYISPEEMVTCLSVLTSLERLSLLFKSPRSSPDQESGPYAPPRPTRSVLPTLIAFWFQGVNEYLEDLLARIDAPRLHRLWIEFFNDIFFDTPQLIQFIGRTLTFKPSNEAYVGFLSDRALFVLRSLASNFEEVQVRISCRESDWQLSALAQICTLFLRFLSTTETLYIHEFGLGVDWKDDIENTEWLQLLLPFTAVKNLYLSKQFAPCIAPALQEFTGGRMTEVLPTLQNLFLEGFQPSESVQEGIGHFISGRQLTNHTITLSSWDPKESSIPWYDPRH